MTSPSHSGVRRRVRGLAATGLAAVALLLVAFSAAAAPRSEGGNAIHIPFEQYRLGNGLSVILAPDHSTPQVTVNVWYHVGSKNEETGHTGFAHMFEHVMFTGSAHVPYGMHDQLTEGVGGNNNGSTTNDRTEYYETVPSNYLEDQLWMEADRMGFLLDKLDETKFVAQRDVVKNERRQRTDNQPYGRAFEIVSAAMLPESNPYSWPVVGYMADLDRASVDDVKHFFRLYYTPGNATLSVVGDFDPAQAKQWVAKYFGDLPAGAPVARPAVPPVTMPAEKRLVFEDRVQVPRLYLVWPSVGEDSDDTYALDVMSSVLAGSRTARITKELIYDRPWASAANAFNRSDEKAGAFMVMLTPRPDHALADLEAATDSVIADLAAKGPTADEMTRALAGIEVDFVGALESNLGKAEILESGAVFHGDPGYYRTQYQRYEAVTAADVQRVARRYLVAGRVVLSIVPEGKSTLASRPDRSGKVTVAADGGHYLMEVR